MNPRTRLGVSANASLAAIKRAYKRLAFQNHPDRGGDPAIFREVVQAFRALTKKRKAKPKPRSKAPPPRRVQPDFPYRDLYTFRAGEHLVSLSHRVLLERGALLWFWVEESDSMSDEEFVCCWVSDERMERLRERGMHVGRRVWCRATKDGVRFAL